MATTAENLQEAYSGESQASRKYLFFAERAEKDGQLQIARLFRAASEAETIHARNHLNAMKGIGTTADNLKDAINGESHEFMEMYPEYIDQSQKENHVQAKTSFTWANKVEQIHHGLYKQALKDIEEGKKPEDKPYFVCQRCGNTVENEAPDKCPICGAPREMFKKVD